MDEFYTSKSVESGWCVTDSARVEPGRVFACKWLGEGWHRCKTVYIYH